MVMNATPVDDGAQYDASYFDANGQEGDRAALWWYARVAARLAHPLARVFDFGSGAGHFARRLSKRFVVDACDASPVARELIRTNAPGVRVHATPAEVPDESFELLTALHVLEHLPDPRAGVRELASKLRRGGRALVVVPNPDGVGRWLKQEDWFAYRDPTHCSLLGARGWRSVLEAEGLAVDTMRADGLWDPPYVKRAPVWLQRPVFGAPAAIQVLAGRVMIPERWGECLVITATRVVGDRRTELSATGAGR